MKKLTLALALILCLILCVFAFASCGPKKPASTTAGGSATASTPADTECNHVWGEFEVDTPATCTAPGVKSKYCTICDEQDPDSITEIPKLDHVPGENYVVDTEPNCTEGGFKSKHCTVCGNPIADTVLPIDPDPTRHNVEEWNVTVEPTLDTIGERQGTCTLCHEPQVEAYALPIYNSKAFVGPYASGNSIVFSKTVGEISGADKTFHPTSTDPDGNDLWIEYSFLWNDTLANWNQAKSEMSLAAFKNDNGSYRHFYYLYTNDGQSADCPYKGHFDYSTYLGDLSYNCAFDLTSEGNGIGLYKAGWDSPLTRASSPYVYDEDSMTTGGWHRIGVRFHQESEIDDAKGGIVYTGYSELYVDGVKVWKVRTDMQGYWKNSKWNQLAGYAGKGKADLKSNDLLLWYAKTELDENDVAEEWTLYNGVYYKDHDDMIVYGSLANYAGSTTAAYASLYDVNWTCGDGFVRTVTPVATPAERTITLDDMGTEDAEDDLIVSAAIFYEVN